MNLPGDILASSASARQTAATRWAATKATLCPNCTTDTQDEAHLRCSYRGREGCAIAPALVHLGDVRRRALALRASRIPVKFWPWLLGGGAAGTAALAAEIGVPKWALQPRPRRPLMALQFVEAFIAGGGTLLALGGMNGCGKSIAACVMLVKKGGLFQPVDELARPLPHEEGEEDPIARLKRAPALVFDEVGDQHTVNGFGLRTMVEIIRHRDHHLRLSILTGNLLLAALGELLGPRIISRLEDVRNREGGGGFKASTDPDQRRIR